MNNLFRNLRFYVLLLSVVLSVLILMFYGVTDATQHANLQRAYGFLAVAYLLLAVTVSPITSLFGKERFERLVFARRAIGVSAWYFTLLHTYFALWGQLGGPEVLGFLPTMYQIAIASGGITLLVLTAMAATSFDHVIRIMTPRRWKMLHRLVYIALGALLLHIWIISSSVGSIWANSLIFTITSSVVFLELLRLRHTIGRRIHLSGAELIMVIASIWAIIMIGFILAATKIQNVNQRHQDHLTVVRII